MKVYVHLNCSSCKKALKWLKEKNLEVEIVNIQEQTPTLEEFELMRDSYAGNLRKLFNTSGQLYREMGIKDTVASMSSEDVFDLLSNEGMLIKRPFLITANKGLVGFKEETWAEVISS